MSVTTNCLVSLGISSSISLEGIEPRLPLEEAPDLTSIAREALSVDKENLEPINFLEQQIPFKAQKLPLIKNSFIESWQELAPSYGKPTEKEKVTQFLTAFSLDFTKKNYTMALAGAGATDLTLICTAERITKFIFKLTRLPLLDNSKLCCFVFKELGMESPQITRLRGYCKKLNGTDTARAIGEEIFTKFAKNRSLHGSKSGNIQSMKTPANLAKREFCFMKAFEGANLKDLITSSVEEGEFLNAEISRKLLKTFGEIALYDLIIGNDDRFFRFSEDMIQTRDTPIAFQAFINPGNVIIDMKDEQIKSANVLCIDNGSFNCLNDKTNEENYEELLDHQVDNFVRVFKFVTEEKNQGTFVKAIIEGLKREEMIYSLSEQEMCTAIKEGLNKGIEEFTKKGETIVTLLQDRLELKKIKGSEGILFYQKVLIMIGSCFKICKERNI